MKKVFTQIFSLSAIMVLSACAQNPGYNRTTLYSSVTGEKLSQGKLDMARAYCRNMVNSHVTPYEGQSGYYSTSNAGSSLNSGIGAVNKAMSGPNYNDCMLSQGFQVVGYE